MPAKKVSETTSTLVTLLNNIDELIVVSNQRKEASEAMRALTIYANNLKFPIPDEKIQNFQAVLLDSRPMTLRYILQSIAADIVEQNK